MCSEQTWTKIYADHFKKKKKSWAVTIQNKSQDYSISGCDPKYLDMESYSAQQRKLFKKKCILKIYTEIRLLRNA